MIAKILVQALLAPCFALSWLLLCPDSKNSQPLCFPECPLAPHRSGNPRQWPLVDVEGMKMCHSFSSVNVHPSKLLCLCSRILVNIWTRSGRSCRLPGFFSPKERLDFKTSYFVLKESRKSFLHQPVWKSRSKSATSFLLICAVLCVCSLQQLPSWRQGFLIPFWRGISSSSPDPLENDPVGKQSPSPCCSSKGRLLVWFVPLK